MNFFEQQQEARDQSRSLVLLFFTAVFLTVLSVNWCVLMFMCEGGDDTVLKGLLRFDDARTRFSTIFTLGIILLGTLYRTWQLSGGGKKVAAMMGAKPVQPLTKDPAEVILLNVVEEIAIASGTAVPDVFLLEEESINAFAAGFSSDDAAIILTRGCLKNFNRDQLQGVIAHEFSHICNGDMALNMRLLAWLNGLLLLATVGRIIARGLSNGRSRGPQVVPVFLFAFILVIVGYIGVFFGQLIKFAVGRQREYLADACAVQFTRNPNGISGALKKILRTSKGSRLRNAHAETVAHMFFAEGLDSMFQTHPPLPDRIRRIEPTFNELAGPEADVSIPFSEVSPAMGFSSSPVLSTVGQPNAGHLKYAQSMRSNIPAVVTAQLADGVGAKAIVYALLLDDRPDCRAVQLTRLKQAEPSAQFDPASPLFQQVTALGAEYRLPLVDMAMPALRRLDLQNKRLFLKTVGDLVRADNSISLFEYVLELLLTKAIIPQNARSVSVRFENAAYVKMECRVLLSALAYAGTKDLTLITRSFELGGAELAMTQFTLLPESECRGEALDGALKNLVQCSPPLKQKLIAACVACMLGDGKVAPEEAEVLRAVCSVLGCPLPPILNSDVAVQHAQAS